MARGKEIKKLSSITLTAVYYTNIQLPVDFSTERIGPNWRITPIYKTFRWNLRSVDKTHPLGRTYTFELPRPVIKTRNSGVETKSGPHRTYNNCLHYGIAPDYSGVFAVINGTIVQSEKMSDLTLPSTPLKYLEAPPGFESWTYSFGLDYSDPVKITSWYWPGVMDCHFIMASIQSSYINLEGWQPHLQLVAYGYHNNTHYFSGVYTIRLHSVNSYPCFWLNGNLLPVSRGNVVRLLHEADVIFDIGYPMGFPLQISEGITPSVYNSLLQWVRDLDLERLCSAAQEKVKHSYPETSLAKYALESFRVKDATLLRELMDTMSDFASVSHIAEIGQKVLPLKGALDDTTLAQVAHRASSLFLSGKYGIELPAKTLLSWADVYTNLPDRLGKEIFPTALRARKSYALKSTNTPGDMSGQGYGVMTLGLSTFDDWRDYINAFYRWGLLLSFSDAWDLVPLSFAIDWVWPGVKSVASAVDSVLNSHRLKITYASRTSRMDLNWSIRGPTSELGAQSWVNLPSFLYWRDYSHNVPSIRFLESFNQESKAGTLTYSSLPQAVALLVSFLT